MLAIPQKTVLFLFTLAMMTSMAMAQQPPSTRSQPVGFNFSDRGQETQPGGMAPPSVHIPPNNARSLPGRTSYTLGDQDGRPTRQENSPALGKEERSPIRQTSFTQDEVKGKQEPSVPEILKRSSQAKEVKPAAGGSPFTLSPPTKNQPAAMLGTPSSTVGKNEGARPAEIQAQSLDQFSKQMNQIREAPRVAPQEIDQKVQLDNEFEAIRKKIAEKEALVGKKMAEAAEATKEAAAPLTDNSKTAAPQISSTTIPTLGLRANKGAAPASSAPLSTKFGATNQGAEAIGPSEANNPTPQAAKKESAFGEMKESVNDFLRNEAKPQQPGMGVNAGQFGNAGQSPANNMVDRNVSPANMQFGSESRQDESTVVQDPGKVSGLRLAAPSLSVESFGPKSIGINKPAQYKVVVTNETVQVAERVMVSIDVPSWVEIDKVNLTAGEREINDGKQKARLIWKIDSIPGRGSQTITITTIPRKAEAFDLGIEWTIAPRAGAANIQVTQPKLEMSIVGPEEVYFGDTAPYQVTIRNSGSGEAENVTVMLSESLGGERRTLGNIPAGTPKSFTVNLFARTPGELDLGITAVSDSQSEVSATRKLVIRRANLSMNIVGPELKYSGTTGQYLVKLTNTGDATAEDVVAAIGLPTGVKFLGGIEGFKLIEGGMRWQVGRLEPGQAREYKINCKLEGSGDVQLEVGAQAKGSIQASHACVTRVQTIADLAMTVNNPPGPLSTGEEITYEIQIENRGTKSAKEVDVFMILSEGMEPKSGSGLEYRIPRDGAIQFATIPQLEPGQKMSLKVNAVAYKPGTHIFRAHLVCEAEDSREIKEGTSKFFGDEVANPHQSTADRTSSFGKSEIQRDFK